MLERAQVRKKNREEVGFGICSHNEGSECKNFFGLKFKTLRACFSLFNSSTRVFNTSENLGFLSLRMHLISWRSLLYISL